MQKILISLSVILLLSFCDGNKKNRSFQLKGTLSDSKAETLYLEKLGSAKQVIIDSVILDENGNFEFTNYTPKIGFYRIKTNDKNFAMWVLDSADKVTITGSVKDLGNTFKVEGSPETTIFIEYNNCVLFFISFFNSVFVDTWVKINSFCHIICIGIF